MKHFDELTSPRVDLSAAWFTDDSRKVGFVDVDVDVVYGRRRMPLCPPPRYNTSK